MKFRRGVGSKGALRQKWTERTRINILSTELPTGEFKRNFPATQGRPTANRRRGKTLCQDKIIPLASPGWSYFLRPRRLQGNFV